MNHIQRLHRASCELQSHQPEIDAIANQKLRKIVDALLDLVSLEGIYPSLSPGVGAPVENRVRSALNGGLVTRPVKEDTGGKPEDAMLLKLIADDLRPILLSNQGLKSIIQERVFVDILSALSELAYCPSYDSQIRLHYQPILTKILDRYVRSYWSDSDTSPFISRQIYSALHHLRLSLGIVTQLQTCFLF